MFEDWYGLFATPKVVGKTRRALAVSTRGVYVPEAKDVDGVHVSTPLSNAGIDTGSWIVAEAASRSWAPSEYAPGLDAASLDAEEAHLVERGCSRG